MALSTTSSTPATPTTTHELPQQHWSFSTPRNHGCCEESSHNPHYFMPRAPPRRHQLMSTTTTSIRTSIRTSTSIGISTSSSFTTPKEFGFLRISNQNTKKKKKKPLLSDRLFLNLDSRNNHFHPLLPSSTNSAFKSRHDKFIVRRIRPTILLASSISSIITACSTSTSTSTSTSAAHNSHKKKRLISLSLSSSSEQHHQ